MTRTFTFFFILSIILFLQCKDESSTPDNVSLLDVVTMNDYARTQFLEFAAQTNGDPAAALEMTRDWVLTQETVEDAIIQDTSYLRILMKSGLKTTFHYDAIDENGISIFRGGGQGSLARISLMDNGKDCSNEITNKNVLIFAAAFTQFYKNSSKLEEIAKIYTDADEDFNVTILKDAECSIEMIETFGDYGLVILDTHGEPDAFLLGYFLDFDPEPETEEDVRNLIIEQVGENVLDLLLSGDIGYYGGSRIRTGVPNWYETEEKEKQNLWVTTKYLNAMEEWPNTVIMGNMCHSASNKVNDPEFYSMPLMRTTFMNRKLISYYGYTHNNDYSNVVTDGLCKQMEDSLSRAFVVDGDSTGNAHLKGNNTEFKDTYAKNLFFRHYNADNYCFGKCGEEITDTRDGKKYKTVCIGDQQWMAENLNYVSPDSKCWEDSAEICDVFGRLYTHAEAMAGATTTNDNPSGVKGICPDGWHLPSLSEWEELADNLGGIEAAGGELKAMSELWKSPNVGATNSTGFSALPGGLCGGGGPGFEIFCSPFGEFAFFHTTSKAEPDGVYLIQLRNTDPKLWIQPSASFDTWGWASIRCVKD